MKKKLGIEDYKIRVKKQVIELTIKESTFLGRGRIRIKREDDKIYFESYCTYNSPLHVLTGFPGSMVLNFKKDEWEENGESNSFQLGCITIQYKLFTPKRTYTIYKIPKDYNGPRYRKRKISWIKVNELFIPLHITMHYQDSKVDKGELLKIKNDVLTYGWVCQFGPNKYNIKK